MIEVTDFTAITTDRLWVDRFGELRQVITYGFSESLPDHHGDIQNAAFRDSFR